MANLKNLDSTTVARLKAAVFLAALIPLVSLAIRGLEDDLGANPIEKITRTTGYWTLTFLMMTLGVTPLRRLSGWQWPARLRRMLGLFAFFYGCLHLGCYLVLDQFFDWQAIARDIAKRPYVTAGFSAFLLMLPLAVTSTDAMIKRLGGRRWKILHQLVYPCAAAAVVHYIWLVKKDLTDPVRFAVMLGLLLACRVCFWVLKERQRQAQKQRFKEQWNVKSG